MGRTISVFAALGASSFAIPCCLSYADIPMRLASETAIIVWDSQAKTQHFVRRASFTGDAKDFGFILPTPTQPSRIEVADEEAFSALEWLHRSRMKSFGTVDSAPAAGVEVLEQKIVGDYQVTVLRAKDGNSINRWLTQNKHKTRPAMTPWFDHYAKKGFVFSAFKYAGRKGPIPTKAVAVTFKTSKPFYPYKMPADTWEPGHHRRLDLYVVGKERMLGKHVDGKAWPTFPSWTEPLGRDSDRFAKLISGDGPAIKLPKGLVVTRFHNSENATHYGSDLEFFEDGGPSRGTTMTWIRAGAAGLLVVGLSAWRLVFRK